MSGKRTTVSSVDLGFTGRITRPEYAQRVQKLREDWRLKVGQPFINSDWNKAKAALLDEVSERDFLLARMTSSAAEIQAEQASAALSVTIDSGPQVNMGELKTEGLERVPEKLVQRYVRYSVGSSYEQSRLDQWQQDLQSTAFFRGAFVSLQQPGGQAAPEPISDRARAPGRPTPGFGAGGRPVRFRRPAAARGGLRFRWRGHAARAGAGGGGAAQAPVGVHGRGR